MSAIAKKLNLGHFETISCFDMESLDLKAFATTALSKSMLAGKALTSSSCFLVAVFPKKKTLKKDRRVESTLIAGKGASEKPAKIIKKRLLVAQEQNGKILSYTEYVAR